MNTQLKARDQDLNLDINLAIEDYKAMQERHIRAFETELLPDLELQNFERAHAFAEIKNKFDNFLSKTLNNTSNNALNNSTDIDNDDQDYVDVAALYITQIQKILDSDAVLREKILIYQKQLKKHLNNTKKFKTAFNGYSASDSANKYIAISLTS